MKSASIQTNAKNETIDPSKEYQCIHTVAAGENLLLIATRYLGSACRYKDIMKLNGKKTLVIKHGEKLKIPLK